MSALPLLTPMRLSEYQELDGATEQSSFEEESKAEDRVYESKEGEGGHPPKEPLSEDEDESKSAAPTRSSLAPSAEESVFLCRERAVIPSFTVGDTPAWFANQETTVRRILCPSGNPPWDLESRSTLLCQQMQSGKTGTYLLYAVTMLLTNDPDGRPLVDKVVILSAFSDNNLKAQIQTDLEALVDRLDCDERDKRNLRNKFKVFHLSDLPRNGKGGNAIGPDTLVIHDECHVGQSEKQTIEACFSEAGIEKVFLGDCSQLEEKNMWYLAVSATPFSELVANEQFQQQKTIVMGETSDAYTGVGKLIERGHVEYYDVRERGEFLRAKIDQHSHGEPGWIIIRAANRSSAGRNSAYEDTIAAADEADIPIKEHNCKVSEDDRVGRAWYTPEDLAAGADNTEPGVVPTPNFLKKPPLSGRTTVVIIAGAFRMGANLPKTHIKAVIDTTANSACDTVLQGLLGRACGYWEPGPEFRVYLSESTRVSVENYAMRFSRERIWDGTVPPERILHGRAMNATGGPIKAGMSFTTDTGVAYLQSGDGKAYRSFPPIKIEKSLWDEHYDAGLGASYEMSAIHNIIGHTSEEGEALPIVQNYHAKTYHDENGIEWFAQDVLQRIRNYVSSVHRHNTSGVTAQLQEQSSKLATAADEGKNCLFNYSNFITHKSSEDIGDISLLLFHDPDSDTRYLTGAYRMAADWTDVKKKEAWRQSVAECANYHPVKSAEDVPIADSGGQQCPIGPEQLKSWPSTRNVVHQTMIASFTSRGGQLPNTSISDVVIDPTRWGVSFSQTTFEEKLRNAKPLWKPARHQHLQEGDQNFHLTPGSLKFEKKLSEGDTVRYTRPGPRRGEIGIVTRIFRDTGKVQVTPNTPGLKFNKQSEANFEIVESRVWAYKSITWDRTPA
jgi:hypothetical protein